MGARSLVSIDVGVHHWGEALWADGRLQYAKLVDRPDQWSPWISYADSQPATYVIEIPVVYGVAASSGRKGDQKDVIDLALRAAWIAGRAYERGNCPSIFYTPAGWKGGMDKATSHAHIACALTESELAKVVLPRSKERQLDVWDAIGVGAHHLHRLPWRRPVPPARL